jgi:DNA-binding response OmpR family regulator
MEELSARVKAILRRRTHKAPEQVVLEFSRIKLDPNELRTWKDGKLVELTKMEFNIIYALAGRPDHVFTRDRLLDITYGGIASSGAKSIDVHIGHIRKKIEDNGTEPHIIETVRGVGYRFLDRPVSPAN